MRYYKIILFFGVLFYNSVVYAEEALMVTDIHFNPYGLCNTSPCPTLSKLIQSDISQWDKILESDSKINYQMETSNQLFITSLQQIESFSSIKSTFVTGDLLSHNFDDNYYKFVESQYKNNSSFVNFSTKTSLYVLNQIKKYTNNSKVYFTLGNNDTDTVDYQMPTKEYTMQLAKFISGNLAQDQALKFKNDGYYSVEFNKNTRLIAINSNVLSTKKTNQAIAIQQLTWLVKELYNAEQKKQNVIILQHIPYSVDTYKTAKTGKLTFNLNQDLQDKYIKVIDKYSNNINFILSGHFHQDYIQLLPTKNPIPVFSSLALNTYFGNNPGFKIFTLDNKSKIQDYKQYYADISKSTTYQLEYNFNSIYSGTTLESKINSITYSSIQSKQYIKYYNGLNKLIPQPINNQWGVYYCAIHNINEASYNECQQAIKAES